ncbi:hypothetical protein [Dolosigranulum savutiense]|uniref:Uncharacterized protein n=1 Tax=Dolosigranulum savutiense TaxID=3110288 RepID=A0AB74U2S1_9LACT
MKNKIRANEGSILVSALLFLGFMAFLVNGVAVMVTNQVTHFEQVKESYLAKTMIQKSMQLTRQEVLAKAQAELDAQVKAKADLLAKKATLKKSLEENEEEMANLKEEKEQAQKALEKAKERREEIETEATDIEELQARVNDILELDDDEEALGSERDKAQVDDLLAEIDEEIETLETDDERNKREEDLKKEHEELKEHLADINQQLADIEIVDNTPLTRGGTFQFNHGTVTLTSPQRDTFQFTTALKSGYTVDYTYTVTLPNVEEALAEVELQEDKRDILENEEAADALIEGPSEE